MVFLFLYFFLEKSVFRSMKLFWGMILMQRKFSFYSDISVYWSFIKSFLEEGGQVKISSLLHSSRRWISWHAKLKCTTLEKVSQSFLSTLNIFDRGLLELRDLRWFNIFIERFLFSNLLFSKVQLDFLKTFVFVSFLVYTEIQTFIFFHIFEKKSLLK